MKKQRYFMLLVLSIACFGAVMAQQVEFDESKYYRLTNIWTGVDYALDVNPENLVISMAPTGASEGQLWKITPQGGGAIKLSCKSQGPDKVIDVINDGTNNTMRLTDNAGYSGQYWMIVPSGEGLYRFANGWQTEKALDGDIDPENPVAFLNPVGNIASQFWRITEVEAPSAPVTPGPKLEVGMKADGGIVFYVDETGRRGLICAEEDFDEDMSFQEATEACENYSSGGKTDWRLPTLDELEVLYENLRKSGKTHFQNQWYWSAEKLDEHNMWSLDLLHGERFPHWEEDHSHVRAVRTFPAGATVEVPGN